MSETRPALLLTGASGQLGLTFRQLWTGSSLATGFELLCPTSSDLDLADETSLARYLDEAQPTVIVNAGAYTAVDKAESEPDQAYAVNSTGPGVLAQWAQTHNARLIHVSTDFVFDGAKTTPYLASDSTQPLGVYGASKLAGEQAVLAAAPQQSIIVRASWLYSPFGHNFMKTMLRLMAEKPSLRVVNDQIGSPTSAFSLARCLFSIVQEQGDTGIYHWCDGGEISWYEFAVAIQEQALNLQLLDSAIPIEPIPSSEYPTPASRPAYSVLDISATCEQFGCEIPDWRHNLQEVMGHLAH